MAWQTSHWEIGRFPKRVVLANVPSFRFPFRGNIRRNHPFWKPPFFRAGSRVYQKHARAFMRTLAKPGELWRTHKPYAREPPRHSPEFRAKVPHIHHSSGEGAFCMRVAFRTCPTFVNTKKGHWEIKRRFPKRVVLANVSSFRFSFRGNIRQNHPFGNHPFANP